MMNRRDFASCALALSLTTMIGGPVNAARRSRKLEKIGIQLYTVRELFKRDAVTTIKMLAKVGYDQIEFANLEPLPISPREFRKVADGEGLTIPATHFNPPVFFDTPQKVIDIAGELGCKYVINSWIDEKERTAAGYRRQADLFNKVGADMRKAGFRYGFHNHEFEFAKMEGNMTGYDLLLRNTDPALVDMELDMYWVVEGGAHIMDLLTRYKGRFKTCHIKDRTAAGKMVNVGEGVIDWKSALRKARDDGMEYFFVEHDEPAEPVVASVAKSLRYVRALRF